VLVSCHYAIKYLRSEVFVRIRKGESAIYIVNF